MGYAILCDGWTADDDAAGIESYKDGFQDGHNEAVAEITDYVRTEMRCASEPVRAMLLAALHILGCERLAEEFVPDSDVCTHDVFHAWCKRHNPKNDLRGAGQMDEVTGT